MTKTRLDTDLFRQALAHKVPPPALEYCITLWQEAPFSFTIAATRSSCLGNYKFENGHHTISINHDLNPYSFLITYLHEVAHQKVQITFQKKHVQPHGTEWKHAFVALIVPVLNETVFPEDILRPLTRHLKNPAASSTRDPDLMKALRLSDGPASFQYYLEDLPVGQSFIFKRRQFKKLAERRSRALCQEHPSGRRYTIPLIASVSPIIPEN